MARPQPIIPDAERRQLALQQLAEAQRELSRWEGIKRNAELTLWELLTQPAEPTPLRALPQAVPEPDYLSPPAAGRRLGVSARTIHRLVDSRDLDAIGVRADRRISVASIEAYIACHRTS